MSAFSISRILLIALACLIGARCGSDDNPTQSGQMAVIEGRVTDDVGFGKLAKLHGPVEGAAVSVARIQADGSLNTVSTSDAQTNANGEFSVEVDLDGVSGLVVVAEKNDARWKAVQSDKVERGSTKSSQPLNDETTTESEMKQRHTKHDKDEEVSHADEAALIDADVALQVKGNAAALEQLALALEAEADAHTSALNHSSIGATQAQIQTVNNAKAQAQIDLEAALAQAAGNQAAVDAAFETHYRALIDAYVDAGVEADAYAKSRQASVQALIKNSASLNSNTQFAIKKSGASFQVRAIDLACESRFQESNASNARLTAVANAGASFRTSVAEASNDVELAAAFQAYHDAILAELQAELSAQAVLLTTIDAGINGVGGAKIVLDTALSAATSTDAIVQAYMDFYAAVTTMVQSTLTTASQAEVELAADVMILANLSL